MAHTMNKQIASTNSVRVRPYFKQYAERSLSVLGSAVGHLSRTVSYQGRMDLHRALNG
ncbi:MAG: hypothetical protein AB3N28_05230 [Kordiimonas sp.]